MNDNTKDYTCKCVFYKWWFFQMHMNPQPGQIKPDGHFTEGCASPCTADCSTMLQHPAFSMYKGLEHHFKIEDQGKYSDCSIFRGNSRRTCMVHVYDWKEINAKFG
mmetsp:Transcript_64690/g.129924  ORF Transcript_64690/g.129924 Transcript_64690/m.129924 type:complete len:106 (+) Transcript_64690:3-320(+)